MTDSKSKDEPLVIPTPDEARNGWTAASLTKYLKDRAKATDTAILDRPKPMPKRANSSYDPYRWGCK